MPGGGNGVGVLPPPRRAWRAQRPHRRERTRAIRAETTCICAGKGLAFLLLNARDVHAGGLPPRLAASWAHGEERSRSAGHRSISARGGSHPPLMAQRVLALSANLQPEVTVHEAHPFRPRIIRSLSHAVVGVGTTDAIHPWDGWWHGHADGAAARTTRPTGYRPRADSAGPATLERRRLRSRPHRWSARAPNPSGTPRIPKVSGLTPDRAP